MGPARRVLQAWNPSARRALARELDAFAPDLVHVRMFMTQLSPAILPLLADVPALLHVVNHDLSCPLNTRVLPDGSACGRRQGVACMEEGCLDRLGHWRAEVQRAQWRRHRGVFDRVVCNSHAGGGVPARRGHRGRRGDLERRAGAARAGAAVGARRRRHAGRVRLRRAPRAEEGRRLAAALVRARRAHPSRDAPADRRRRPAAREPRDPGAAARRRGPGALARAPDARRARGALRRRARPGSRRRAGPSRSGSSRPRR